MNTFAYYSLYLFTNTISTLLSAVLFLMLVRLILSLLPLADDNPLEEFVYNITEPFVLPVRAVIDKFDSLASLPIDIAFFIAFILLSLITEVLSIFRI